MLLEHVVHAFGGGQTLEVRYEVDEFGVVYIVEPGGAAYCILRMKYVGGGRVVQYDDFVKVAT